MGNQHWQTSRLQDNKRPLGRLIMYPGLAYACECLKHIDSREPGSLCYVVGPGGTGKTSLWEALPGLLFGNRENWPADQIPIISISVGTPDRGYFSSGVMASDLLREVLDPFRPFDLDLRDIDSGLKTDLKRAIASTARLRMSGVEKWAAFISIARQVGLRHILVDEANLMVITQQNRLPSDYIETLRAAAMAIGCTVVFFGTHDILHVMDFSAQSNRRTLSIQIERLLCRTTDEQAIFLSVAEGIASDRGIAEKLIGDNAIWLYEVTYGIVGEIDELFKRAILLQKAEQAPCLIWEHVQRACHLPNVLERMRFEADLIDHAFGRDYAAPRKRKPAARGVRKPRRRKAKRHATPSRE